MGRLHTFVVTLRRDSREVNWGLRLVGGSDLATPLIVTRVTPGTPAGKELVRGDIIAKIDDYDARDLRHEDAQNLFRNAPKQIKLVVQRDVDRDGPRSTTPMAPRSPIPMAAAAPYRTPSPQPGWRGPESLPRTPVPPHGPAGPAGLPHYSYPLQLEGEYRTLMLSPSSTRTDDTLDESIQSQPYRTTPLVLPGAKVRREPGPTESYLRHHPNPAMRAPPSHDYRDTLMRQKVAESVLQRVVGEEGNKVVHKQFNSPINLYSEQNIANSIRQQTSPLPHKPTVQYDPARSETFRALQEDGITGDLHEVPTPVTPKVFTAPANKKPVPRPIKPEEKPKGKQTTFVNSLHEEHIQQSNSFKRLMYNVLGDTEF
ncbi:PDZ and LIM domain protein 3 isoform X8 [Spodoptera frugiperda]|uniref:PDZ and LIM domain protein 3 isoform X8 n=1 Tax=Spodoptera frugiperda TaxID=7108 RepID=A0A9R0F1R0_SPOFR|nr:PDZ and LIM domain protein 3 isoform X8 [Spodoptera frugiperda]